MMEKIWKLLVPLLSAIIGIWFTNCFNIFEKIPFVPADYSYEVCITAYFAIVDAVLGMVKDNVIKWIKDNFFSGIEVVFYPPQTEPSIASTPVLKFNEMGLTEVDIAVKIKGKKKHFENSILQVKDPAFVDFQENYQRTEVRVTNNIYMIDLDKLFGGSDETEFTQNFRLLMAQGPVDGESTAVILPEIKNKHKNVSYKHNKATVKVEG